MTTHARPRSRSRGFSTPEILAGMVLGLVLAAAIYSFQQTQLKAYAALQVYSDSQNVTRTAIDLMTRELRMASYDPRGQANPACTGPPSCALALSPGPVCPSVRRGLVQATPSTIRFQQDLNGNGVIDNAGEDVTYDVLAGDLRRKDGAASPVPLVSGVPAGGLTLLYFDGSNPPVQLVPAGSPPALSATQRDCVSKVRVVVTANLKSPRAGTPITSTAETVIAIRNRSLMNF